MAIAYSSYRTFRENNERNTFIIGDGTNHARVSASAEQLLVITVSAQNIGTSVAASNEIQSMVGSVSGEWTKVHEYRSGNGTARDGVVQATFFKYFTTAITNDEITVTFDSARQYKTAELSTWTVAAGTTQVSASSIKTGEGKINEDGGILALSGLPTRDWLFFRGVATKKANYNFGANSGWTSIGTDFSGDIQTAAMYRIIAASTASTDSNPITDAHMNASTLVAFTEGAASDPNNLTGANATQGNTSSTGAIQVAVPLSAENCLQGNTSSTGAISQTHVLVGATSVQTNPSPSAAITQVQILAGSNSTQVNNSAVASVTSGAPTSTLTAPAVDVVEGSLIAVFVRYTGAATDETVSDTASNTYTAVASVASGDVVCKWFYKIAAPAHTTNEVTLTLAESKIDVVLEVFTFTTNAELVYWRSGSGTGTADSVTAQMDLAGKGLILAGTASEFADTYANSDFDFNNDYTKVANSTVDFNQTTPTSLSVVGIAQTQYDVDHTLTFTGTANPSDRAMSIIAFQLKDLL